VRGAREVGGAVTASTLTTVAVFLPIAFVTGIAGEVFADLALSVVFALATSLGVALTFVPMLAARVGRGTPSAPLPAAAAPFRLLPRPRWRFLLAWGARGPGRLRLALAVLAVAALAPAEALLLVVRTVLVGALATVAGLVGLVVAAGALLARGVEATAGRAFGALFSRVESAWPRVVRAALGARPAVVLAALALLALAGQRARELPRELVPRVHQGEIVVDASLPIGTPLSTTDEVATVLEQRLRALPGVARVATTVGVELTSATASDKGEHSIAFAITLIPARDAAAHEEEVTARVRRALASVPNLAAEVRPPALLTQQSPLEIQVMADDLGVLREATARAQAALAATPGLTDVRSSVHQGSPEIRVRYDRERLAALGLRVDEVAEIVRAKVRGVVATRYRGQRERVDVVVRLAEDDRATVRDLSRLVVNPGAPRPVPLASVADLDIGSGPAEIHHVDGSRAGLIRADHSGIPLSAAVLRVREVLDRTLQDRAVTHAVVGQQAEVESSQGSLLLALALAIFLVYIVMASQFESVLQPLVLLVTVPLAAVGAVAALDLTGLPISVVVFLGLIVLVGIAVNNAIVLVDRINALRGRGLERRDAVAEAARQRLRPILMTTLTTVLGLLPLALGRGDGAEIRVPLAVVVVGGLLSSTLLTLVVVPVVYDLVESARDLVRAPRAPRAPAADAAGAPAGDASHLLPAGERS
jgi:HAE1 family hydrophobic/amphiphilic exporter-1